MEVYGMIGSSLHGAKNKKLEATRKNLNIEKVVRRISADCFTNMVEMKEKELIVMCTEVCLNVLPDGFPAFYKVDGTDNYTRDSAVCSAGQDF